MNIKRIGMWGINFWLIIKYLRIVNKVIKMFKFLVNEIVGFVDFIWKFFFMESENWSNNWICFSF